MATSTTCDGCGMSVAAPKRVGHALIRDYCEACAIPAEQFVDLEEALRKETHESFTSKRGLLIQKFYDVKGRPATFKLPDVPDVG